MPFPDIEVGDLVTADLLDSMLPRTVIKTVDESVNTSIVNQDDNELALDVLANASYLFTGFVRFSAVSTTPDLRANFSVPSGATFRRQGIGQPNAATAVAGTVDTGVLDTTTNDGRGALTSDLGLWYSGYLITSSTAGVFRFVWSQVTSSADNVTVKAGSWMRLERVA
jgi:hypothetical protein